MEKWENNIIADKLNSLQDLPEGYSPNLGSKWEIIQSALDNKRKKPIANRWLWSVIIILLGMPVVWLINQQEITQPSSARATSSTTSNHHLEDNSAVLQPEINTPAEQKQVKKKAVKSAKLYQNTRHEIKDSSRVTPAIIQNMIIKPDTIQLQRKDSVKMASPIALKTKPLKKVYQRDFEGIVSLADSNQHKTARKNFQIKLAIQNKDVSNGETPTLRLTQKL